MSPAIGTVAASSNETFDGLGATRVARATAYSAHAPEPEPKTSSPGPKPSTSRPTASTTPARSAPTRQSLGLRNPAPTRAKYGPVTPYHSTGLTDDACTRTSTWSSSGTGTSTSRRSRTPGSGRPYCSWTIACIRFCPRSRSVVRSSSIAAAVIFRSFHVRCMLML